MSETRIRRGGGTPLKASRPAVSSPSRPRGRPAIRRQTGLARILASLPFSEATLQRMMTWTVVLVIGGAALGIASFFGLPGMARMEMAELAAKAGFQVEKVEVRGAEHMDQTLVYNIALGQVDRSMLNVDLPNLRAEIMKLSWVKDARISRRLPDTLVVDIVERQPVAIWQNEGKLALIDVTGGVLDLVRADALPDLPLVVGPNANLQTPRLTALMESAPALKPVLAGATWVGNRRWDLRFQSGETLSLPEGEQEAAAALVNFTRLDGVNRLLGRGIIRFDMRDPDKFVLRLPKNEVKDDAGGADSKDSGEGEKATAYTAPKVAQGFAREV